MANPRTWEKVVEKVRTRVMPPPGFPPVTEAERKAMVEWIETTLARADALAPPNPGRVTARRLNRTEYDNSVRDLLGVDLRPAAGLSAGRHGLRLRQQRRRALALALRSWRSTCSPRRGSRARRSSGRSRPRPASCASRPRGRTIEPASTSSIGVRRAGLSLAATRSTPPTASRSSADIRPARHRRRGAARRLGAARGRALPRRPPDGRRAARSGGHGLVHDRPAGLHRARPASSGCASPRGSIGSPPRSCASTKGFRRAYGGPNPSKRADPPAARVQAAAERRRPRGSRRRRKAFEARRAEKVPVNRRPCGARVDVLGPYDAARGPSADEPAEGLRLRQPARAHSRAPARRRSLTPLAAAGLSPAGHPWTSSRS